MKSQYISTPRSSGTPGATSTHHPSMFDAKRGEGAGTGTAMKIFANGTVTNRLVFGNARNANTGVSNTGTGNLLAFTYLGGSIPLIDRSYSNVYTNAESYNIVSGNGYTVTTAPTSNTWTLIFQASFAFEDANSAIGRHIYSYGRLGAFSGNTSLGQFAAAGIGKVRSPGTLSGLFIAKPSTAGNFNAAVYVNSVASSLAASAPNGTANATTANTLTVAADDIVTLGCNLTGGQTTSYVSSYTLTLTNNTGVFDYYGYYGTINPSGNSQYTICNMQNPVFAASLDLSANADFWNSQDIVQRVVLETKVTNFRAYVNTNSINQSANIHLMDASAMLVKSQVFTVGAGLTGWFEDNSHEDIIPQYNAIYAGMVTSDANVNHSMQLCFNYTYQDNTPPPAEETPFFTRTYIIG